MKIAQDFTQLIGHTPLLRLNNFERHYNLQAELIAKIQSGRQFQGPRRALYD